MMKTLLPTTLLLLFLLCGEMVVVVKGYPNGPPLESCQAMFPTGHHADAMNSPPPYTLTATVPSNFLVAGAMVTLWLNVTNNPTYPYYEGLFVQARKADCSSDEPLGAFSIVEDGFLQLLKCNEKANSAVAHKASPHTTNKTFTWTVPAQYTGPVYFRATVVKNEKTFWTNVFSEYLTYANDSIPEPAQRCAVQTSSAPTLTLSVMAALVFSVLGFWCTGVAA